MNSFQGLVCTQWGHWRELQMQAIERLPLAPGQVRIRVRHAGVGFAVSLFVSGKYQRKPPLPFTPGTEVSGEIIETAPDVTRLKVGQTVMAALDWGAFAEEAVATADTVYPIPADFSLAHAAALPVTYGTAWSALQWRANLRAGDVLLVHGASGSLGMAAVQTGKLMGAHVIATASTEAKRTVVLQNGASHALPSDPAGLAEAVKRLCPKGGVDVVFDPVGGDLFDASLRCVSPEARMLTLGFASGHIASVATNHLLVKNASVIGFNYGYYIGWGRTDERARYASKVQEMTRRIVEAIAQEQMPQPVIERFPFAQWETALDAMMSRRAIGKVVLDIS